MGIQRQKAEEEEEEEATHVACVHACMHKKHIYMRIHTVGYIYISGLLVCIKRVCMQKLYTCIQAYMHTCTHACTHAYIHACRHACDIIRVKPD